MKIKLIAATVAMSFAVNALPALADEKGYTPSERAYVGGGIGLGVGAGAGYLVDRKLQSGGISLNKGPIRPGTPEYRKKYLKVYGEEHVHKVEKAQRDLDAKKRLKQKELRAQKKLDRKLAKENPKVARKLKKERLAGKQFNAHQKHQRDMRTLERKIGAKTGTAEKHVKARDDAFKAKHAKKNPKFGSVKPRGHKVQKNPKFGSVAARNAKKGSKAARTAKTAKTVAKVGKTGRKLKTVGRVAAGGAVGLVAGAALGEKTPDVFDAAGYTVKMARNPKNAPKMLYGTAKGGVAMADRMADTVTDPGKMARNLGNAANGVGRTIANTGAYKSFARTKTGRSIGKATGYVGAKVGQGYKSFARSKTGKAAGAVVKTVDKYTFKAANKGVKATSKVVSKVGKAAGKTAKKEFKKAKKTAKKVGKAVNKTAKKAGKALKKAFGF